MRHGTMHKTIDLTDINFFDDMEKIIVRELQWMIVKGEFNNNKRVLKLRLITTNNINSYGYTYTKVKNITLSIKKIMKININIDPKYIDLNTLGTFTESRIWLKLIELQGK